VKSHPKWVQKWQKKCRRDKSQEWGERYFPVIKKNATIMKRGPRKKNTGKEKSRWQIRILRGAIFKESRGKLLLETK